jgi:short-subunit dehydrogenase
MKKPQHILITGASSGIGQALAECYAGPGIVLIICGRNQARLSAVVRHCKDKGAVVFSKTIDVQNRTAMADWITKTDTNHPIDLVLANAGISAGSDASHGKARQQVRAIFDININGVLNTIHPAIECFQKRQRGQLALVSSIAGFRGLPSAPAYSASKACIKAYGEGLRGQLKHQGMEVSVICPGFVKSRITDANTFTMPFLMDAETAAIKIRRGLEVNRGRIVFPWPMHFIAWLTMVLPSSWMDHLLSRLPEKT